MSTSSLPPDYLTTLNDINTITLTSSGSNYTPAIGTITFDSSTNMYTTYGAAGQTFTLGSGISGSAGTISIDTESIIGSVNASAEWKDRFPYWDRVQRMSEQYPALKIALRNFQTVYELVKDDYDNPTPKK